MEPAKSRMECLEDVQNRSTEACRKKLLLEALEQLGLLGQLGELKTVTVGVFAHTLPSTLDERPKVGAAFVFGIS